MFQREQHHAPAPTHAADAARETKPALVAAAAGHSLQGRGFPSLQLSMSPFLWLNVPERRSPTGEGKRPETRDEMGPKAARASAAEALVARRVAVGQAQSPFHVSAPALLLHSDFLKSQKVFLGFFLKPSLRAQGVYWNQRDRCWRAAITGRHATVSPTA